MDEITLENFRCFHEKQRARLAPLTLLVGENSVGKTSFMALIRALWSISYNLRVPDFKESPYDLGSFDEIAHHRGGRGGRADTFKAGYSDTLFQVRRGGRMVRRVDNSEPYYFEVTFGKRGSLSGDWGGGSHGDSWKQHCRDLHRLFTAAKRKPSWTSGSDLGQWASPPR